MKVLKPPHKTIPVTKKKTAASNEVFLNIAFKTGRIVPMNVSVKLVNDNHKALETQFLIYNHRAHRDIINGKYNSAAKNAKYAMKYDCFTAEALRRRGKTSFVINGFNKLYVVSFIDETCVYIKNRCSLRLCASAVNI